MQDIPVYFLLYSTNLPDRKSVANVPCTFDTSSGSDKFKGERNGGINQFSSLEKVEYRRKNSGE